MNFNGKNITSNYSTINNYETRATYAAPLTSQSYTSYVQPVTTNYQTTNYQAYQGRQQFEAPVTTYQSYAPVTSTYQTITQPQ